MFRFAIRLVVLMLLITAPVIADNVAVSPAAPSINVWQGTTQNFGQLGNPQLWVNVLGRVSGSPSVTSLKYSLNGGPDQILSIGSNSKRLYGAGDFNIELPVSQLIDGTNTVLIKANDGVTQSTATVTVNYEAGNIWPLPYTANWSQLGSVQAGAQVVDGQWDISGGRLRTIAPGFDRFIAIGDMSWTDYEVTVPVTVLSLNTSEWGPPSNGAGVGLLVRWLGHYDTGTGVQPREGWRRLGGLAWHRWAPTGTTAFEIFGDGGQELIERTDRTIALNTPYIFKLSVQSSQFAGLPSTYRFKFWPTGQPEPAEWYMTAIGNSGEPEHGSILLVAHQAMVSFGNVTVRPLPTGPFTINVQDPNNGNIIVTPNKASYSYGERVTIRAQGVADYSLANWTGDLSGSQNPVVVDVTDNLTIGGVFAPLTEDIRLNLTTNGQGIVNISPNKSKYLYGEVATLTPQPAPGFIFAGWTGDATGANNPVALVMDRTKTLAASFTAANAASPISDDFNACNLNTGLWTFVNPVGDGSYTINGTQLLLTAPANVSHNIGPEGNRSVRVMQPIQNSDFEIIAKFESSVTQRYQMQGVVIEQDSQNYVRFEIYHDGVNIQLYAERFLNGEPQAMISGVPLLSTPPYLRITRAGDQLSFSYSDNGISWTSGGSFTYHMTVTKSGVYGANHGTPPARPAPAYTAIVDYFFNSAAPIVPEDDQALGNYTLNVNKVGQGNVTRNPSKATYDCNEQVTLMAMPVNGWTFAGWSGDLTGTQNPKSLTMTGNKSVTANFSEIIVGCHPLFLAHSGSGTDPDPSPDQSSGCAANSYLSGAVIQLTTDPANGWHVAGWIGTDNDSSTSLTNTVTMPDGQHTVTVVYERDSLTNSSIFLPSVLYVPPTCMLGSSEIEPNNAEAEATGPLCPGRDYTGGHTDRYDVYSLNAAFGTIIVELENYTGANVQLQLHYERVTGNPVGYDGRGDDGYRIELTNQPAGIYYIRIVDPNSATTITYTLRADFSPAE